MNPIVRTSLMTAALIAIGTTAWSADKHVTLKDAYREHFLVGTAINRKMATGAGGRRTSEQTVTDVALIEGVRETPRLREGGYVLGCERCPFMARQWQAPLV